MKKNNSLTPILGTFIISAALIGYLALGGMLTGHAVYRAVFDTPEGYGCSSWIALGGLATAHNKPILHKNRDENAFKLNNQIVQEVNGLDHDGEFTYLAVTNNSSNSSGLKVYAGVNENGVAVASNFVAGTSWSGVYTGPTASREILENSHTVEAAYDWILANRMKFQNGNIFLIAGLDDHGNQKGYVVEVKQSYNWLGFPNGIRITSRIQSQVLPGTPANDASPYETAIEIPAGVRFRSNHYKMFGNVWWAGAKSPNSVGRYNHMLSQLTSNETGFYGEIDVHDSNELSSSHDSPTSPAICRHSATGVRTLAGVTIEIDPDEPINSDLYFAHGYPCENPYLSFSFSEATDQKLDPSISDTTPTGKFQFERSGSMPVGR